MDRVTLYSHTLHKPSPSICSYNEWLETTEEVYALLVNKTWEGVKFNLLLFPYNQNG